MKLLLTNLYRSIFPTNERVDLYKQIDSIELFNEGINTSKLDSSLDFTKSNDGKLIYS